MLKFWTPFLTILFVGFAPYAVQQLDSIADPISRTHLDLRLFIIRPLRYIYFPEGEFHDLYDLGHDYNSFKMDMWWGEIKGIALVPFLLSAFVVLSVCHLNEGMSSIMRDYIDNNLTYILGFVCIYMFFWFVGLEVLAFVWNEGFDSNYNVPCVYLFESDYVQWWSVRIYYTDGTYEY